MPLNRNIGLGIGQLERECKRRKWAFDAMVAKTVKEAAERGVRTADDVLKQMDAVIATAERRRGSSTGT